MTLITRIRRLETETNITESNYLPIDNDSYVSNAKKISFKTFKGYISGTTYGIASGLTSGTSGISGSNGSSGSSGTSGTSGTGGLNGSSGSSGLNGIVGSSGSSGTNGNFFGSSGSSGSSGISGGSAGSSGSSGANGTSGSSGSSGSSGINGTSGISGTSGYGSSGSSGSSGMNGANGSSGSSGFNGDAYGSSGSSGVDGANAGTSGTNGTSGSSGSSGLNGTTYGYWRISGDTLENLLTVDSTDILNFKNTNTISWTVSGLSASEISIEANYVGTAGSSGSSGSSGISGVNGTSGSSGKDGTSGVGVAGTSGSSGISGSTYQNWNLIIDNIPNGGTQTIVPISSGNYLDLIAGNGLEFSGDTSISNITSLTITNIKPAIISNVLIEDFSFDFNDVTAGIAQTYYIDVKASYNYRILSIILQTDSGSALSGVTIKINGITVGVLNGSITVNGNFPILDTTTTGTYNVYITDVVTLDTTTLYAGTPTFIRGKLKTMGI